MQRPRTAPESLAPPSAFALVADPDHLVEAVARRVVELFEERRQDRLEPYLNVEDAARVLACKPQRIYDLRSQGRLRCAKEGSRLLTKRSWIDDYLEQENP